MILKTFCAFLALVLELCGVYGNGKFKFYYGYVLFTSKKDQNLEPNIARRFFIFITGNQ